VMNRLRRVGRFSALRDRGFRSRRHEGRRCWQWGRFIGARRSWMVRWQFRGRRLAGASREQCGEDGEQS
jgi:hypothetical protein